MFKAMMSSTEKALERSRLKRLSRYSSCSYMYVYQLVYQWRGTRFRTSHPGYQLRREGEKERESWVAPAGLSENPAA